MVGQRGAGKERKREMEDVCRLHGSQQSLLEGFLPAAQYRCVSRQCFRVQVAQVPGFLFWLQPDHDASQGRVQDHIYDRVIMLLLQSHAFWTEECKGHLPRLMDKVLAPISGRMVQAYVDDMVVTTQQKEQHAADLEELFATIAKYWLKLNPEKCVFGVEA